MNNWITYLLKVEYHNKTEHFIFSEDITEIPYEPTKWDKIIPNNLTLVSIDQYQAVFKYTNKCGLK